MNFIVKLFPEITIKSTSVRKRFIKQLRRNLKTVLATIDPDVVVTGAWDSLKVTSVATDKVRQAGVRYLLSHTPGIGYWLEAAEYPLINLDDMLEKAVDAHKDELKGETFCVRCKRAGQHNFTSIDVERFIGAGLNRLTETAGVRLKNPDVLVRIEIKNNRYFMVQQRGQGLGGFPMGTQEPVMSLISGGFDSTVSSFLTMRRGIRTHFCFFNLGGSAHELAVKEVAYYLWHKFSLSHNVKFVTVPFEGVVEEILTKVDNSQMGVVLKRMMVRAASKIAEEAHIPALVTGEAVGQVSSQTLTNLTVIDKVTDQLVLRPLIAMDKQDIINTAEKIGTAEFARHIPEYCAVISRKPTTCATMKRILEEESHFDFSVLDQAVEDRRIAWVRDIAKQDLHQQAVEVVHCVGNDDVLVDIRHPTEEELNPLVVTGKTIKKIPFYRLATDFVELDRSRQYLLYCEKGVMSQLQAMHLRDEGYSNVAVFRPEK
ncbi:tRNA sulfurtransferase [invertebrate metagenome]|uniref:tRNA sulfurtransferase n=1 Tax=invertebrate metagenome TaxID=1711999 RepID=A0A2H9T745_9ZZZZ